MSASSPTRTTQHERFLLNRYALNRLEAEREDAFVEAAARAQLRAMRRQAQLLREVGSGRALG